MEDVAMTLLGDIFVILASLVGVGAVLWMLVFG